MSTDVIYYKNVHSLIIFRSSPSTPLSTGAAPSPPLYHRYYQDCNAVNSSGNLPITLQKYWEYRNSRPHQRGLEEHQNEYDPGLVYVKQEWIPMTEELAKDWNWRWDLNYRREKKKSGKMIYIPSCYDIKIFSRCPL